MHESSNRIKGYRSELESNSVGSKFSIIQFYTWLNKVVFQHPAISITLRNELTGEIEFQSFVSQNITEAFRHLVEEDKILISFHDDKESWSVRGLFGLQGHHDKSKQFTFVNNRWMKRSKLTQKLAKIFKSSIATKNDNISRKKKTYPIFVLFFECPLK